MPGCDDEYLTCGYLTVHLVEYWLDRTFFILLPFRLAKMNWTLRIMVRETVTYIKPEQRDGKNMWEMTRLGNVDHIQLMQRVGCFSPARITQIPNPPKSLPPQPSHQRPQWEGSRTMIISHLFSSNSRDRKQQVFTAIKCWTHHPVIRNLDGNKLQNQRH